MALRWETDQATNRATPELVAAAHTDGRTGEEDGIDRREVRGILARDFRIHIELDRRLGDEGYFLADTLVGFGGELVGALPQHREDGELVTRKLPVVPLNGGLQGVAFAPLPSDSPRRLATACRSDRAS